MIDMPDDDELPLAEELFFEFCDAETLPADAMRAAINNWASCRELFVDMLEAYAGGELDPADDGDALLFLLHLFGQMRETQAYRPLLKLLTRPIEELEATLGDTLDETLPRILTSIFDGDAEPLEMLILDPATHDFVRWSLFDAYAGLVRFERVDAEQAEGVLLAAGDVGFDPQDAAWIGWLRACAALGTPKLLDTARVLMESGKAAPTFFSAEDFAAEIAAWADDPEHELASLQPLDDAIAELSGWHGFSEAGIAERRKADALGGSIGRDTNVNPYRKVGRNDPCPCGSGKKFKKCHGA